MVQWKIDLSPIGKGAIIEQAKVEAMRAQAEFIEEQNQILRDILTEMKK